jgi:predicted nuclease with TOPRIM domain
MNEALAIGIPTFAVVLGIFWNNARFNEVAARFNEIGGRFNEVAGRFGEVNARLDRIEADLRQFYHELGRHEGEIQSLRDRK